MARGLGRYLLQRSSDVLNHLGLRDRWGSTTATLTVIHPDDVFLVSMPRSGSNWVRLMLASLKAPDARIHFGNVNDFIPTLHSWTPCDVDALPRPRIIKTHYAAYRRYPRFLAVVRDPRDVMVSMYHFYISTRYFDHDLPFARFIRSGYARWPLDWSRHTRRALAIAERDPGRALVVRYEDLRGDPTGTLVRLARHVRLDPITAAVERAVAECSWDKLRAMEGDHKPRSDFRGRFFRDGSVGQWSAWFDDRDMRWFLRQHAPTMQRLGYLA